MVLGIHVCRQALCRRRLSSACVMINVNFQLNRIKNHLGKLASSHSYGLFEVGRSGMRWDGLPSVDGTLEGYK